MHTAPMLTIKDVSHRTGISLALVYREIHAGRLRAHCFGKRTYRVSEGDLASYLASTAIATPGAPTLDRCVGKETEATRFKHLNVSRLLSSRQ
jgi:excisionase family DNA binding protein